MQALSAAELLDVWERGRALSAPRRALLLLGAACPEASTEALGELPVGRRDELLLSLRAAVFGARLEATTGCPRCSETLELEFSTQELCELAGEPPAEGALEFELAGHAVALRQPNGHDLVALTELADPDDAEHALLRRCVLSARQGAQALAPDALPQTLLAALSSRLAEADPLADLQLALTCPDCDQSWSETFDIVSFFWWEIEAWATQLLREVHTLASAYGWSEQEIVALSPHRRRAYLELVAT